MRNRLLTLVLCFMALSVSALADDNTGQSGSNQTDESDWRTSFHPSATAYTAPTRVMNYNSVTKDIDLVYYLNDKEQLHNMCNGAGTFTNVNLVDGEPTGGMTQNLINVQGFPKEGVSVDSWENHALSFTTDEMNEIKVGDWIGFGGKSKGEENNPPQLQVQANGDVNSSHDWTIFTYEYDESTGKNNEFVSFNGEYLLPVTQANIDLIKQGIVFKGQGIIIQTVTIGQANISGVKTVETDYWSPSNDNDSHLSWDNDGLEIPTNNLVEGRTLRFYFKNVQPGAQVQLAAYRGRGYVQGNKESNDQRWYNLTVPGTYASRSIITLSNSDYDGYYDLRTDDGALFDDQAYQHWWVYEREDTTKLNLHQSSIYIKGEKADLAKVTQIYDVRDGSTQNNGDYLIITNYGRTFNKTSWEDTGHTYKQKMGEEKRQFNGEWKDRAESSDKTTNPPTLWRGNNIRSVTIYTQNNYQMNDHTDNGDKGDQIMFNGLYPKYVDLSGAEVSNVHNGDNPPQWYMSNPETPEFYTYNDQYKHLMNVIFNNHNTLIDIRLPKNTELIGYEAFSDCDRLKTVHMPNTVKVIGNNAFGNCPLLESIKIFDPSTPDKDDETVQVPKNLEYIANRAFQHDWNLNMGKDGVFSFFTGSNGTNKLKGIGDLAFNGCINLAKEVDIPNTVSRIGQRAFANPTTNPTVLNKVVFNYTDDNSSNSGSASKASELEIGQEAFSQQDDIYYHTNSAGEYDQTNLQTVVFNPGTYAIDAAAFRNDVLLRDLGLKSKTTNDVTFTRIGARAFENCHSLPSDDEQIQYLLNNVNVSTDGRPAIGNNAFANCNGALLQQGKTNAVYNNVWNSWYSISIPNTWAYIPAGLFFNDFNLNKVTVSRGTAPETENTLSAADMNDKEAKFGRSIALNDLSYNASYPDASSKDLGYPFQGVVSNGCQLVFEDAANTTDAKESYRKQTGFLRDILTKYIDDSWKRHESTTSWEDSKISNYYYCVNQDAADVVVGRTLKGGESWNSVALPFEINNKETLEDALGIGAVPALYAADGDKPLEDDNCTLHFVQLDWSSANYDKIGRCVPFIVRNVDTSKSTEYNDFYIPTLTKGTDETTGKANGAVIQATNPHSVTGYKFQNVNYQGGNNNFAPEDHTESRTTSPYNFVSTFVQHSTKGAEDGSDNRLSDVYFIQNNKFWSTDQITKGDKKLSTKAFRAYFTYTQPSTGSGAKQSVLNINSVDDDVTGIDQAHIDVTNPDGSTVKAKVYNLQGQLVDDSYKGVVIVNGKKIIRR